MMARSSSVALVVLSACASWTRPAPPPALGVGVTEGTELGWGLDLRLGRFEVKDVALGGAMLRVAQDSMPGRRTDRLSGERITRFRLDEDGEPAWNVACRAHFPDDSGGQGVEQVCRFVPAVEGRPELRLVLASPVNLPLSGAFMRGDAVLAEIDGTRRLPSSRSWPRTTGVSLYVPGAYVQLAFVSTTATRDAVWFAPETSPATQAELAPAVLALAVATDPRNQLNPLPRGNSTDPIHDPADRLRVRAMHRPVPPPVYDPEPSSFGRFIDPSSEPATGSPVREGGATPDSLAALSRAGRPDLARALSRAEASHEEWLDRPRTPAPLFGPDLREGRHAWFVLVDGILALTGSKPVGVEGGPSFGWYLALGLDLWDVADLYGFVDLMARHPLGDDAPLDREHAAFLGYGVRLNLLRVDDVRIFAGFEHALSVSAARLVDDDTERARWRGEAFGPTAGVRIRLGETLEGRAADLRLEGVLHREQWRLEYADVDDLLPAVERWTPSFRTVLQVMF